MEDGWVRFEAVREVNRKRLAKSLLKLIVLHLMVLAAFALPPAVGQFLIPALSPHIMIVGSITAGAIGMRGQKAMAATEDTEKPAPSRSRKKIKIAFIGGGSQTWAPRIIRDIVWKTELQNVEIEIALIEIHMGRAKAVHELFKVKFKEWSMEDRVKTYPTLDPVEGLTDADFVIITISTGRLPAMSHDLAIPEKYSIYQKK